MTTSTTAKCPRCGKPVPAPPPPLPPRLCERCLNEAKKEIAAHLRTNSARRTGK